MNVPYEFDQLAKAFYPGSDAELADPTLEAWIDSVVQDFRTPQQRRVIIAFLDELLNGKHDDAEIQRVWDSTSPSYQFTEPSGTRYFLELIRERI